MAEAKIALVLDVKATLTLNEQECRALDALIGYGTEPFITAFYKVMGEAFLRPHVDGLRTLFEKFGAASAPAMKLADETRKTLLDAQRAKVAASVATPQPPKD